MYEQISPDTSHIRYEETDLSYLKLRPYRFKCGIYTQHPQKHQYETF